MTLTTTLDQDKKCQRYQSHINQRTEVELHCILNPLVYIPFKEVQTAFASKPCSDRVFPKILNHYINKKITSKELQVLLVELKKNSTEEQWKRVIDVLNKKIIDLSISEFNTNCSQEYQIPLTQFHLLERQSENFSISKTNFVVEPNLPNNYILIYRLDRLWAYKPDGNRIEHKVFTTIENILRSKKSIDLVFLCSVDNDECAIHDMVLYEDFIRHNNPVNLPSRRLMLERLYNLLFSNTKILLGEHYNNKTCDEIGKAVVLLWEQNYKSILLKQDNTDFFTDKKRILSFKRESVCVCDDIIDDNGVHLVVSGKYDKKKFETRISMGLTFDELSQCLTDKTLIGKKLSIIHCGYDHNDKLIFPIFKTWKE